MRRQMDVAKFAHPPHRDRFLGGLSGRAELGQLCVRKLLFERIGDRCHFGPSGRQLRPMVHCAGPRRLLRRALGQRLQRRLAQDRNRSRHHPARKAMVRHQCLCLFRTAGSSAASNSGRRHSIGTTRRCQHLQSNSFPASDLAVPAKGTAGVAPSGEISTVFATDNCGWSLSQTKRRSSPAAVSSGRSPGPSCSRQAAIATATGSTGPSSILSTGLSRRTTNATNRRSKTATVPVFPGGVQ